MPLDSQGLFKSSDVHALALWPLDAMDDAAPAALDADIGLQTHVDGVGSVNSQEVTMRFVKLRSLALLSLLSLLAGCGSGGSTSTTPGGTTQGQVTVGGGGNIFNPVNPSVRVGSPVTFNWAGNGHPVVFGANCTPASAGPSAGVTSGAIQNNGQQWVVPSQVTNAVGTYPFYCTSHCGGGMAGTLTVTQ